MHDPAEGVASDGTITTGADRSNVGDEFEPVIDAAIECMTENDDASLYLYGSVATGMAVLGQSDVDLLTVGLSDELAKTMTQELSTRFSEVCRSVEVAAASPDDFDGDDDEVYGGRVFLRHYCVHLEGPVVDVGAAGFPADRRAARGFNGDIARHITRWRAELDSGGAAGPLGRRVGRKTLLVLAGLVSVTDGSWTTDRQLAANRWAESHPEWADDLNRLLRWSDGASVATSDEVRGVLGGIVSSVCTSFATEIGLWE